MSIIEGFEKKFSGLKLKILVSAIVFAIVWNFIIVNNAQQISSMPFLMQFLIVTIPSYLSTSIIFGVAVTEMVKGKALRNTLGMLFLIMASDILAAPMLVNLDGTVNTTAVLSTASIDIFLANTLGGYLSGFTLFLGVYVIGFIVAFSIGLYLISNKTVLDLQKNGI